MKNPIFRAHTKHIEVHYHYIRDQVLKKEIELLYCPINEQIVDILTKALTKDKFEKFQTSLGVMVNCIIIKGG